MSPAVIAGIVVAAFGVGFIFGYLTGWRDALSFCERELKRPRP